MAISVGSVSVDIVPSAATFARDLRKTLLPQATAVGKEMGKAISDEVAKALGTAADKSPTEQYKKEGEKAGGAYGSALKASIERAIKSLPDIELTADSTGADHEIQMIRDQLKELSGKTIGIDLDARDAEIQLEGFREHLDRLRQGDVTVDVKANTAAAIAAIDKFQLDVAKIRDIEVNVDADTSRAQASLAAFQARAQLIRDIRTTLDLDIGSAMTKIALFTAAMTAIPAVVGGGTYAVAAFAAALVPAAGAIALLPAAVGAAGLAIGTLKIGMSGVADAVKLGFDPTKVVEFEKALAKLSPAARDAVLAITGLKPVIDQLKMSVQDALFQNLGPQFAALGQTYIPILRVAMTGLATDINGSVTAAFNTLRQSANVDAITTGLGFLRQGLGAMSGVLAPLTQSFIYLFRDGAPFVADFGRWVESGAQSFARFIANAASAGQITVWIQNAVNLFRTLGLILGNVGSALWSLITAANTAGSDFLGTLQRITGEIAGFLRSAEGQSALVTLFVNIRAAVDAAMPGVRAILGAFGDIINNIGPALPSVGAAFSAVMLALRPFVDTISSLVGTFLPPLMRFITECPTLFIIAAGAVWGLSLAFDAIKTAATIATAAQTLLALEIGGVSLATKLAAAGNVIFSASTWTGLIPALGAAAAATWAWTVALLANPITWVVIAIVALVAAVILAYQNFEWFRNIVDACWRGIVAAATWAWETILKPIFIAVAAYVMGTLVPAFLWLWHNVIVPAFEAIGTVIQLWWDYYITPIFNAVVWIVQNVLGPVFNWLWHSVIVPAFEQIGLVISWWWTNIVTPVFNAVVWFVQNVLGPVVSWLYNTIFKPVFDAIGVVISWWWTNIVTPVFNAAVWFVQNILGPAITWLYWTIFKPMFDAIGLIISWVWTNIILPVFNQLKFWVEILLGGAISFFYNGIIKPIWDAIGAAISFVWLNIIKPTFDAIVWFINTILNPTIQWLLDNVVRPVFDAVGAVINGVWLNVIQPAFTAVRDGLNWLGDNFNRVVDWIGTVWNRLRGVLAAPVNFLIGTVWNQGILPAWNAVAGLVGLPAVNPLAQIPAFAAGGPIAGPGGPTSDSVPIMASHGEFMVRSSIAKKSLPFLTALNAGNAEALQATGGARANIKTDNTSDRNMKNMLGMATGGEVDARINAAMTFAQSMQGTPYIWGGTGRAGMDCSGYTGAITHVLRGADPFAGRLGTTATWPWSGFTNGATSRYTIGVNAGQGHQAGTLNGQNVESGSGHGAMVGGRALGTNNFPAKYTLPEVGGAFAAGAAGGGGTGYVDTITPQIQEAFRVHADPKVQTLVVRGNDREIGSTGRLSINANSGLPPGHAVKERDNSRDFLLKKAAEIAAAAGAAAGGAMGATSQDAPGIVKIISDVARSKFGADARKAAVIGTSVGLVESNLTNSANATDHDSVGVFQQRPSQGWGTVAQLTNVAYAAGAFFGRFPGGWQSQNGGDVAANIQRPAAQYRGRYAQRMGQAESLVTAHGAFDTGGIANGVGILPKNIISPERVLTPRQTESFDTLVRNLDSGRTTVDGSAGGTLTGNLYLDSGEFMGKVRGTIGSANSNAARQLTYGRS